MADEKIITSSVFEQGITEIMQDIANNLYEFEEYTEEEVANLIDLSEEEVAELTRVINDTTVALNKVYSNKKVEDLLTELEIACNQYADEKIGGLAGIHLDYVDALPATGEDNVIYILKSTTGGNDTLNLYNNGWISIGEFTISLDNYYDKTEVDTLLNDKANKNEVFSQNDVVNDMSNVSSSTVLSTAGLEVELDKKVDKDSIATVLDGTVTDEQVPSAKAVYDKLVADISNKANKNDFDTHKNDTTIHITKEEKDSYAKKTEVLTNDNVPHIRRFYSVPDNDWNNAIEEGYYSIAVDSVANTIANRPCDYAIQVHVIKADTNDPISVYQIAYVSSSDTRIYIRKQKIDGKWSPWGIICTATVADVGKTTITPINSAITGTIAYTVKNGICYVSLFNVKSTTNDFGLSISTTMPKPAINCGSVIVTIGTNGNIGFVYINENTTQLKADFYIIDVKGNCSFSYPVAE